MLPDTARLRISVENELRQVTLRLEGRLVGAWVKKLEDAWREVDAAREGRPLSLDISALEHVDQAGEYLLALVARRGVRLNASGIAIKGSCAARSTPPGPTPPRLDNSHASLSGADFLESRSIASSPLPRPPTPACPSATRRSMLAPGFLADSGHVCVWIYTLACDAARPRPQNRENAWRNPCLGEYA